MPHTPHRCDPATDSTPTDPGVGLIIEHTTTVDMPDGQPLPPLIFDGVVWRVVCRLASARTRWRRISLAENPRPDRRQIARAFNSAAAITTRKK
jgi:hypothetical protein